jgi:uncharacterized membrane protein YidH (DUF202 family)
MSARLVYPRLRSSSTLAIAQTAGMAVLRMSLTRRNVLGVLVLLSVSASIVAAWRNRKADETARMTLAYWASVGIAFVLAAAIVLAVIFFPS